MLVCLFAVCLTNCPTVPLRNCSSHCLYCACMSVCCLCDKRYHCFSEGLLVSLSVSLCCVCLFDQLSVFLRNYLFHCLSYRLCFVFLFVVCLTNWLTVSLRNCLSHCLPRRLLYLSVCCLFDKLSLGISEELLISLSV